MSSMQRATITTAAEQILESARIRFMQIMCVGTTAAALGSAFAYVVATSAFTGSLLLWLGSIVVYCLALILLVRRRRIQAATVGLLILYLLTVMGYPPGFLLAGMLALLTAATMGNQRVYVVTNVIVFGKLGFDIFRQVQTALAGEQVELTAAFENFALLLTLLVVSLVTRYFINTITRATHTTERGALMLHDTALLAQKLAAVNDVNVLMNRVIELVRDELGFYHAQIFRISETGEHALLAASTGEVGRQLLERKHNLRVGSQSVVGQAALRGEPIMTRNTETDPVHFRNVLLPETRSELALPVMAAGRVMSVLDVQSRERDAFSSNEIEALQVIAHLFAATVQNLELGSALVHSTQEAKRMFLDAEAKEREIQRINQQLTRTAWESYLGEQRATKGITLEEDQFIAEGDWSEELIRATQSRRPVTEDRDGEGQVIAVPVILRGEVIGAIEVEPGAEAEQRDTVEMVQAVAQRLAISLDNARLFEEAQKTAAQEQRISEIVTRYQSVGTVDDLLRITLTELSHSLGAQRSAIRLGTVARDKSNGGAAT